MTTRIIKTMDDQASACAALGAITKLPITVTWTPGEPRTIPQNSLLHMWFNDISKHLGDTTPAQVKGDCHYKWGLPIRLRDPQFAWLWNESAGKLSEERQRKVLQTRCFAISSGMNKADLTEYMDEISADYVPRGVRLTDPEMRKYEAGK